jgi:hypothetical protein
MVLASRVQTLIVRSAAMRMMQTGTPKQFQRATVNVNLDKSNAKLSAATVGIFAAGFAGFISLS